MMNTFLFKPLATSYVFSYLYLVLVYGFMQDWWLLSASALKAIGYAYLVEVMNRKEV